MCGAQHPDHPEVHCERIICVEYHRSGTLIWTEGAQSMPPKTGSTEVLLGIARRTRARARSTDPDTSYQAAVSVGDLTQTQARIYELLLEAARTDEEIYERMVERYGETSTSLSGARTRRAELVAMGLARDAGGRDRTRAGRLTIIWEAIRR
jgi:hypothetical protein